MKIMHCLICGIDFNTGYWNGTLLNSEYTHNQYDNTYESLLNVLCEITAGEMNLILNDNDMICTMCTVLLKQFHKYQWKCKTMKHLILKSTYRTNNIDKIFPAIDYEQLAMESFTMNDNGRSYSCDRCSYRTCYSDTVAPHYVYHKKCDKSDEMRKVDELNHGLQTDDGIISVDISNNDNNDKLSIIEELEESYDIDNNYTIEYIDYDLESNNDQQEDITANEGHLEVIEEYIENDKEDDNTNHSETTTTVHPHSKDDSKIICNVCTKEYATKLSFKTHYQQHLKNSKARKCHICDKILWTKNSFNEHVSSHENVSICMYSIMFQFILHKL